MATCGYLCPKCEGRGFTDDGEICDWCTINDKNKKVSSKSPSETVSDEDWIEKVHNGPCCGDLGQADNQTGK
jgi:hypothetical protein